MEGPTRYRHSLPAFITRSIDFRKMIKTRQIAVFILVFGMAQNCFYHHHATIIMTVPAERQKEEILMAVPLLKEDLDSSSSSKEEKIVTTTVVSQPMESGFGAGGSGMLHLLHDGVLESPYLQFATDMMNSAKEARGSRLPQQLLKVISPPSLASANGPWVYVLDNRRLNQLMGPQWCSSAVKNLERSIKLHVPKQQKYDDGELERNDTMLLWPRLPDRVVLMHLHDSPEFLPCPPLYSNELLPSKVQYHQRSVAVGRHWNASKSFVDPGTLALQQTVLTDNNKSKTFYREHCPMSVRTDMVAALAEVLQQQNYQNATLAHPLHLWSRPVHVTYHWEDDSNTKPSSLRSMVLQHLREVQEQNPEWNMTLGLVGKKDKAGRRSVQKEYIQNMLTAKIIVLAQRDGWEDHLRFMEAMITGALVMTDPMLAMPFGLVDGESVVVYHNLEELTARLKYYLDPRHAIQRTTVAAKGRLVAMSQHRSFHHAERILLGRVRSVCSNPAVPLDYSQEYYNKIKHHGANSQSSLSACPYVVHASEFG